MDEIIKTVSEKAGISADQARKAVEAVADFAKGKFPQFAGQIDGLLKGGGSAGGGGLADKLGGMFGS